MNKIILIALVSLVTTACGASAMNTRLDTLERENMALRRQNGQLQKGQSVRPAPAPAPAAMPAAPAPAGRAWVRQAHGQYVCIVDYDAHLSMAPRVRFENKVDNFSKRRNSWVSFTLNGQPVAVVRSTVMGASVQYHLGPSETCYVELGAADNYQVVGKLYKNRGSYQAPVLVDAQREMRWNWDASPHDDELPFVFQRHHF